MVSVALVGVSFGQDMTSSKRPIELREVVDSGTKYADQIIDVHACFIHEFEISVLQPCGSKFSQFSKYSVSADHIDEQGNGGIGKITADRNQPLAVVVKGRFQVSQSRKYGHLDFYKRRFIVYKLETLEGEP